MSILQKEAEDKMLDDIFGDEFDAVLAENNSFSKDPEMIYDDGSEPVGIREFIESDEYLNLSGKIYPRIIQCLEHIEQGNIREAYMLLGKGSGKTTSLQIYMTYGIYKTLKLKNPQDYYRLLPGDPLVALLVSVSEKQAKEVGFAGVVNLISRAAWFKGKYEPLSKEIRFPKRVTLYCGHSGATAWLGFNTFRAAMDEVEWMVDSQNRSVSRELYRALKGSLNSRFPDKFKLLCISSVKNEFSVLNSMYNRVRDDENSERVEIA